MVAVKNNMVEDAVGTMTKQAAEDTDDRVGKEEGAEETEEIRMKHQMHGHTVYEKKVDGEWETFGECFSCSKEDVRLYNIKYGFYCKDCYDDITSSPKYQRDGEEVFKSLF